MLGRWAATAAALVLLLAGCADPQLPYWGRPGGNAPTLAVPLAIRLAIAPPPDLLMPEERAKALSEGLATALRARDVPATATERPLPLDWRVELVAERAGRSVQPRYRLLDQEGRPQATADGEPVAFADWSAARTPTLDRVAQDAATRLTRLLLQVEAARKSTDPASLAAGPPRILLAGIRGAPGDGNAALGQRMREFLSNQGFVIQDSSDGAGYALEAEVTVAPTTPGTERVEIVWIVSRRDGYELGRVAQLNEVPAGRLSRFWGDIAYAAAEEAADGVRTVVANTLPADAAPRPTSAPPAPGAAPAGPPRPGPARPDATRPGPRAEAPTSGAPLTLPPGTILPLGAAQGGTIDLPPPRPDLAPAAASSADTDLAAPPLPGT